MDVPLGLKEQLIDLEFESLFLYGSHARRDAQPGSDYELGVAFTEDTYDVGHKKLESITQEGVRIRAFKEQELLEGSIQTPFTNSFFLRELALTGITIARKNILKNVSYPRIHLLDLIKELHYSKGCLSSAQNAYYRGHVDFAANDFSKSCLYAARCDVMFETHSFPTNFLDILKESVNLRDFKFQKLLGSAYRCRNSSSKLKESHFTQATEYFTLLETKFDNEFSVVRNAVVIP